MKKPGSSHFILFLVAYMWLSYENSSSHFILIFSGQKLSAERGCWEIKSVVFFFSLRQFIPIHVDWQTSPPEAIRPVR
jgi:hypothetical protein